MKCWYKSKTLWFNVAVAGLAALEASFGAIQPLLGGDVYAYGVVLLAVGNAVLRVISAQEITLK